MEYKNKMTLDIQTTLEEMKTQPILFVGSGMSKRYFNAPNWIELLNELKERCELIPHSPSYYIQDNKQMSEIGSIYTDYYREWAWANQGYYPKEFFEGNVKKDVYIKYEIKRILDEITPKSIEMVNTDLLKEELTHLLEIQPHTIITTNYDEFLENIFTDYQSIIGQKILKPDTMSIGEIFKIHGCVNNINEIILNEEDYETFTEKKKYLSAKLLAFFAEHPLLFLGYSANDKNIQSILSDIDELISMDGEIIPNIYFLEYDDGLTENSYPQSEKVLMVNGKEIRVKLIIANSYDWVFQAFSSRKAVENVHPKLLRALMARTYKLIRSDIPSRSVEINFQMLSEILEDDEALPNLYGVTMFSDSSGINLSYPFTLTDLGKKLGYNGWHGADDLIAEIAREKGINIKATDNIYHVYIKSGRSGNRKYSHAALELLEKVKNRNEYTVNL